MNYETIIKFWFESLSPNQWWSKDSKLDHAIKEQYLSLHQSAAFGELSAWREHAKGALAEIIILDQFSRNIYRNSPLSFAYDGMALILAQEAIRRGLNQELPPEQRAFLYLPYMHSESHLIHETALELFSEPGLEGNLEFEEKHFEIIKKFGRYPHRNAVLGRKSTSEELKFLKTHSGF